jgi:DNA-binding IclR family transcriptional regulator
MRLTSEQAQSGGQSIRRALAVLRTLAESQRHGMRAAEVAGRAGLTRPTVHRILNNLMLEGLVEQRAQTGRYMLGEQISLLALARPVKSAILTAAESELDRLAGIVGDTLFFTVRTKLDTLCIARRLGTYPIQVLSIEVGARRPLGVSSAGIALLAGLPKREADEIVELNQPRFGSYRVDKRTVVQLIQGGRRAGYALRLVGIVPGTRSISVAVSDRNGAAVAALTVSAIARRLPPRREVEHADLLRSSAATIEMNLKEQPRDRERSDHGGRRVVR